MALKQGTQDGNARICAERPPSYGSEIKTNHIGDIQRYLTCIDQNALALHVAIQGCQNTLSLASEQYSACHDAYLQEKRYANGYAHANEAFQNHTYRVGNEMHRLLTCNFSLQEDVFQLGEKNRALLSRVLELESMLAEYRWEKNAYSDRVLQSDKEGAQVFQKEYETSRNRSHCVSFGSAAPQQLEIARILQRHASSEETTATDGFGRGDNTEKVTPYSRRETLNGDFLSSTWEKSIPLEDSDRAIDQSKLPQEAKISLLMPGDFDTTTGEF